MKITSLALLFACISANAHIHGDWATVHQVDFDTHDIVHTASAHSQNRLAGLVINCDRTIALYEYKTYLRDIDITRVRYSIDGSDYNDVQNHYVKQGYRSMHVDDISNDVYDQLARGEHITFLIKSENGERDVYTFGLNGMNEAFDTLMELCNQ